MFLFSLVCLGSIVIDQIIKFLIERYLYGKSIDIIENIFSLTYLENNGAAWGIFSDNNWILLIFVPVLIGIIGIYLYKNSNRKLEKILGGLIVGGALGNYIDRLFRGYVIDFLDFKVWPIFNFADVCIVIGCILFIIISIKDIKGDIYKK